MDKYYSIGLDGLLPFNKRVHWVDVFLRENRTLPLGVARYRLDDDPELRGFRMDMGKGIFFEHLDDPDLEKYCQECLPKILEIVADDEHPLTELEKKLAAELAETKRQLAVLKRSLAGGKQTKRAQRNGHIKPAAKKLHSRPMEKPRQLAH